MLKVSIVFGLVMLMVACDPGGRLQQLTPVATPMILGVTVEPPPASSTAEPSSTEPQTGVTKDDPSLPAWTVLYYASTDGGRSQFVWDDLNEMEAAGETDEIRLVAQINWTEDSSVTPVGTVRYLIQPDDDPQNPASETVQSLGEINMGDPATLADFLIWGIETYPANRYILILGGYGAGWQGCCYDENTDSDIVGDRLSLPDIDLALAAAYNETQGTQFEVITFAAGLMNQLDVLQAMQPFGTYLVASADLMPGSSWDFQSLFQQLNANPLVEGRQLASDMVSSYGNNHRQFQQDEYAAIAAIDLAKVPALAQATEAMATSLAHDPALYGAIAAEARRGAQQYGAAALTDAERIAAVDLQHAVAIIAENSPVGDLLNAAMAVGQTISDAVVAYDHGQGIPYGSGIAIYWPADSHALDPSYPFITRLPAWADFLTAQNPQPVLPSTLTVNGGLRDSINITNPALMRSELIGQRLGGIVLVTEQIMEDGRRMLRQYEILSPPTVTLAGGTNAALWKDGRRESLIVWDAITPYLFDSQGAGDFVPLQPVDPSVAPTLSAIGGVLQSELAQPMDATSIFGPDSSRSIRLWVAVEASDGTRMISEVRPRAGDTFQPTMAIHGVDGTAAQIPGVTLIFDEEGVIYRSARPLPGGNYEVGIQALVVGQSAVRDLRALTVDQEGAIPGFRAFVDADNNVQFLYPMDWQPPIKQEGATYASNPGNTTRLQVRTYPDWQGDVAELQAEVVTTFGDVSILLQEPVTIGHEASVEGLRTAYGYQSDEEGSRTGMFLAFKKDRVGYVVDLDGPSDEEATTIEIANAIALEWRFLGDRLGFGAELWTTHELPGYSIASPAAFDYQEFNNWHRFTGDSKTFVAVRILPASRTPAEAMSGLLRTASDDVVGFMADEPEPFFYAGHTWERNDFSYVDPGGAPIKGLLLSRLDGDMEIAFWAEGPAVSDSLLQSIFLPVAASIVRQPVAPSG